MEPQTRRLALPNRIRYPTDCLFASSCSPPQFAMTQLLSATALWLTPTGTSTLLISCPRGRTIPRDFAVKFSGSQNFGNMLVFNIFIKHESLDGTHRYPAKDGADLAFQISATGFAGVVLGACPRIA
jgi:hypothetical protein